MKEATFSQWLIRQMNPYFHCQRVEVTTGSGVPDINCCWHEGEFWIETKISKSASVYLRKYQKPWILQRQLFGGKVYVLCLHLKTNTISVWNEFSSEWISQGHLLTGKPFEVYPKDKHFIYNLKHVLLNA